MFEVEPDGVYVAMWQNSALRTGKRKVKVPLNLTLKALQEATSFEDFRLKMLELDPEKQTDARRAVAERKAAARSAHA